jgi:DNA-binding NtrC family response regulator
MNARILIIDDEPGWVTFAKDSLEMAFEVEVAADFETALAKLEKNQYDLIITSSRRLDVLEAIKKDYPEKRVVVASGQPTAGEAIATYRLGALDYFAKDFRQDVVWAKIQEAIRKPVRASAS